MTRKDLRRRLQALEPTPIPESWFAGAAERLNERLDRLAAMSPPDTPPTCLAEAWARVRAGRVADPTRADANEAVVDKLIEVLADVAAKATKLRARR